MTEEKFEVAKADKAMLEKLQSMASKDEDLNKIPVLKINYDAESKYERGKWVVGQQKDKDGNITDEGLEVDRLVILEVRNRYNLYVQTDTTKNCNSPYHKNRDVVAGSRLGIVCGQTCPHRAIDANPRCKAQKIAFGLALTKEGKAVECVSYIQGDSYMPFVEYYKFLTNKKESGGYIKFPPFAHITMLGSEKKKNAGTVYWAGRFEQGAMFTMPQIEKLHQKQIQVVDYIETVNKAIVQLSAKAGGAKPATAPAKDLIDIPDEIISDDVIDAEIIGKGKEAKPELPDFMAGGDKDFDIEAAIKGAIKTTSKDKAAAADEIAF